jgi:sulfite exporter TauE/SafE
MLVWLGGAAVAALAGSPHCLGMCGALACSAGERKEQHLAYHLGRITTYGVLGAMAGAMGRALPGPTWLTTAVAATFLVGFAAALAGLVPEPRVAVPGLARMGAAVARRFDLPSRFLFGVVGGLLPCGLVYATLSLSIASGSALSGAAVMATFGLCTIPALLSASWGLRRVVMGSRGARRALAAVVLVSGLLTLSLRAGALSEEPTSDVPPCHQP